MKEEDMNDFRSSLCMNHTEEKLNKKTRKKKKHQNQKRNTNKKKKPQKNR
jgi:hypothetical protein